MSDPEIYTRVLKTTRVEFCVRDRIIVKTNIF